jgi:hypothetical protein
MEHNTYHAKFVKYYNKLSTASQRNSKKLTITKCIIATKRASAYKPQEDFWNYFLPQNNY